MSSIKLNTATMKSSGERIESISNYYSKKKSTFTSSAFGTGGKLGQFLTKLQKVYEDIGSNLKETNKVLKEYTEDIEGLEKQMSGGTGVVKATTASSEVSKWKNSVKNIKIDESQIFQIQGYGNVRDERHKSMVEGAIGGLETVAGCGLAFMEGLGNLVEMLVDGGGMLAAGACSILGYEERAEEIGEFVARDISKEKYEEAMKDLGIDKYMEVDGTAAKVFSMAGNIVGMVGLSILTGGIAAEVFGAGTAAASTVTAVSNAGIQALNNMGSEGEAALQRGATVKEAEEVGLIAASVGAITGFVSGKIDAGARAIGAKEGSSGLGKICTKVLAAFGVGSSEPIINEIAHTAIYRQEEGESFKESFIKNASEDGLILQIAMAGGANALGTLGNGIGGIKRYNSLSRQIEEAMSGSGVTVIEIADKSEISPELMKKLGEGDLGKVEFKIGDEIYEIKGGGFFEKIDSLEITQEIPVVNNVAKGIRALSDEELELKKMEYKELLDSNDGLQQIILREQNGYTVEVSNELLDDYNRIKILMEEIQSKKGTLNLNEALKLNKISQDIDASVAFNVTGRLISLDELFLLLNDSDKFRNLTDSVSLEDQRVYGNALKNLMETADKNGIDLGLSDLAMSRARHIIDNYSFDYVKDTAEQIKSSWIYNDIVSGKYEVYTYGKYKKIFDDDVKYYLEIADNPELKSYISNSNEIGLYNFCNKIKSCYDNVVEAVVEKQLDVGEDNYNYLVNKFLSRPMTLGEVDYLAKYNLYYTDSRDLSLEQLNKLWSASNYAKGKMLDNFVREFGDYVDEATIRKKINGSIFLETDNVYLRNGGRVSSMGHNNGVRSCINIKYVDEAPLMLESIVNHESIHQISNSLEMKKIDDSFRNFTGSLLFDTKYLDGATSFSNAGVCVHFYDANNNYLGRNFVGINESITEYLSKISSGIDNPCGYNEAVVQLDLLVKSGAINMDSLKKAYFSNDIGVLVDNLNSSFSFVPVDWTDKWNNLFKAFDDAINGDAKELSRIVSILTFGLDKKGGK